MLEYDRSRSGRAVTHSPPLSLLSFLEGKSHVLIATTSAGQFNFSQRTPSEMGTISLLKVEEMMFKKFSSNEGFEFETPFQAAEWAERGPEGSVNKAGPTG